MRKMQFIPLAAALALLLGSAASAQNACCAVTAVSPGGQITAAEVKGARKFQFRITQRSLMRSVRVGSPVYANFDNGQVSLDGKRTCCTILRVSTTASAAGSRSPSAATAPARAPGAANEAAPAKSPPPQKAPPAKSAASAATDISQYASVLASSSLPRLTFGPPQDISSPDWRAAAQRVVQLQNKSVRQLRGNDDIARATGLPQSVKDVLWLHARTLDAHELDSYIVVPELARAWAAELPDEMKQFLRKVATDDGKKKKKGCSTSHISTGCVKNEVEQTVDDLTRAARKAWKDTVDEWGRLMSHVDDVQACFEEKRRSASVPLRFDIAPTIGFSFEKDGKSGNKHGGASGNVKGSVTLGVPVRVDAVAKLDVFYIPCLPFAVRPRSLGADGGLEVEGLINARIDADGEFDQHFAVPPTGGMQIPVAVIPVILGGVPIAVLDISVYLDGTLQIDGRGSLDGNLKLRSVQASRFSFECSGHGCKLDSKGVPAPATAAESFQLNGRINVKPAIYSALQLGLNYNVLNARAGPQPYLLGDIRGCLAGNAAQSTGGSASSEAFHALTADIDWGVELRAEAMAGGQKVAGQNWKLDRRHLHFQDLANSSALLPSVTGMAESAAGQPAAFTLKMPTCYPYEDSMQYRVQWTGTASTSAAAPTSAASLRGARLGRSSGNYSPSSCTQQSAQQGSCEGAPLNDTMLYLAWPESGDYKLTVSPQQDRHGRKFDSSRSGTQVTINVK